jgi:hypothetical protein
MFSQKVEPQGSTGQKFPPVCCSNALFINPFVFCGVLESKHSKVKNQVKRFIKFHKSPNENHPEKGLSPVCADFAKSQVYQKFTFSLIFILFFELVPHSKV